MCNSFDLKWGDQLGVQSQKATTDKQSKYMCILWNPKRLLLPQQLRRLYVVAVLTFVIFDIIILIISIIITITSVKP